MCADWLIENVEMVNEGRHFYAGLQVRASRIETIAGDLEARPGEQVVDAAGLLSGMTDDQVHFRESGLARKADTWHESRACAGRGITSFMEMPSTRPPTLDRGALEANHTRAAETPAVNCAYGFGARNETLEAMRALDLKAAPGDKMVMGASAGTMLASNPGKFDGVFDDCPTPIVTHCEDTPMIDAPHEKAHEKAAMVKCEDVLSKCGGPPFEGRTFQSSIAATSVNGQRVWDGARVDDSVRGQRPGFAR